MRAYEHYLQKSASLRLARIRKYEEERKEMLEGREMALVGEALRSFKLRMDVDVAGLLLISRLP